MTVPLIELQHIIVYLFLSGFTIFIGGFLSHYLWPHVKSRWVKARIIYSSIAFGGGILIAAIGLVLAPKGMQALSLIPIVIFFLAGAPRLFFVDRYIERKGIAMAQLLGMLSGFVPVPISMGTVFS